MTGPVRSEKSWGSRFERSVPFQSIPFSKTGLEGSVESELPSSRLLKAKYFKHVDFLQASLSSCCSHVWRSFMWGRGHLLKRLRWKVGNGSSIKIFKVSGS
ncbi:hypothetical protein Dsin_030076 [Dipteronia sinensis]|uniref:Uncharacterized protein n=1 Tax=Dipteronia sinensis TaxID=43782 RepID=A0AAD9ZJW9_9ROSI|nr:hypothetical protein Dsin_030076 [Dipteronia sinensis]